VSEQRARTSALEAMHEEEALGRAYDVRLMGRLWGYVRPYGWQVALTLFLVFPIFAAEVAPAWIIKTGLDRVILEEPRPLQKRGAFEALMEPVAGVLQAPEGVGPLVWLGALFAGVALLASALQFLNQYVMARTGQSAMKDLRQDVFRHIQRLHLGFFDRYPVGRMVTRATNDVENVAEMFSAGIVALITDLIKMIGFATVLFLVDAKLALLTFGVIPPMALAAMVFRLKARSAFRVVRVRIARINAYIQENVTGMKELQLFTREARNFREFDAMNAEHRDAWFRSVRYDAALFSVVELAQNLTLAIILWQATELASAGTIYIFIDLLRRFFMPLRDLSAKYSVMQSSMASCERIFQLIDTQPAVRDHVRTVPRATDEVAGKGEVVFDNVWFAYQPDDWVLRGVSFRVRPGERVAFVGATGAGKTTLIKLLTRLYDVSRGSIRIDGVDIRDLPQQELRKRVAMVLQDVFLFSGSIAENIALERDDVDRETLERVARAVQAHRFIERLPQGYDSPVRERGSNLSTGQRQLLSFARALAHGADILVLDEATSAIDRETEALIQQGIHVLMEGKTALVIAHRLSTIRDVDTIHVLHKGRLVESGSHAELLSLGGAYAHLYRLQYQGQEHPTAAAG
jgi:ABC-type multidrug transport system fused ATPase/permease subunit